MNNYTIEAIRLKNLQTTMLENLNDAFFESKSLNLNINGIEFESEETYKEVYKAVIKSLNKVYNKM